MFKKFSMDENISSYSKVKSSVQRNIRNKILEQYPQLEKMEEDLLPKKEPMFVAKCHNHLQIIIYNKEPLFFNQRDGPFMPTLRLLHQYKGAIPYVMAGANIMCPGLTSKGGALPDTENCLAVDTPVAILAEGKQMVMGVGILNMSTDEIREKNKGIAIELGSFLGDDLWKLETVE